MLLLEDLGGLNFWFGVGIGKNRHRSLEKILQS